MALYNKDGTVYKLDGPNPVMKSQEFWSEFTVHNMEWKTEVHQDKGTKFTIAPKKEAKTQSESFVEELEESKNAQTLQQEITPSNENSPKSAEPLKNVTKADFSEKTTNINSESIKKTFIHCLPAFVKEKEDSLYGDVSTRIEYSKKTSFEAVIINQNDIKIEMWAEVYFEKGSILYPKNGDKRWWKIHEYYNKLGGYVIIGVPSQDQPYFE